MRRKIDIARKGTCDEQISHSVKTAGIDLETLTAVESQHPCCPWMSIRPDDDMMKGCLRLRIEAILGTREGLPSIVLRCQA